LIFFSKLFIIAEPGLKLLARMSKDFPDGVLAKRERIWDELSPSSRFVLFISLYPFDHRYAVPSVLIRANPRSRF